MRAVIQRVKNAEVKSEGERISKISDGLLVFLGVAIDDSSDDVNWMVDKIINLRIFEKENGYFNESVFEVNGEILIVSQFTLFADCSKGRRPSFSEAMPAEAARSIFDQFVTSMKEKRVKVETGVFQTSMDVSLTNHGPVTIIIDSKLRGKNKTKKH